MPRLFTVTTAVLALAILAEPVFAQVRFIDEEGEARKRRADQIAAELVEILPGVFEKFQARRRLPPVASGHAYQASAVESLLADTEAELKRTLDGEELAPLRDHVTWVFDLVRGRLRLPRQAGFPSSQGPRILLAAWSAATGRDEVDRSTADNAFDQISALIRKIFRRSKARELTVSLCVMSHPHGLKFTMSAASLPDKVYETYTDGEVLNAYRGLYSFNLGDRLHCGPQKNGEPTLCQGLDLWDSPPVLDCNLLGPYACRHRERERGDCKGQKR
jgi:hypothetical protein